MIIDVPFMVSLYAAPQRGTLSGDIETLVFTTFLQVARDIPYSALQFMTFEILKRRSSQTQTCQQKDKEGKRLLRDLWMGAVCLIPSLTLFYTHSQA